MRITQWGEYATHFCIFLAKEHQSGRELTSASELAEVLKLDLLYAQQILQRLRKGNIIKSIRGVNGGYCLTKSAEEISLKDILVAAEGDTFEPLCENKPIDKDRCSSESTCGLRGVWYELRTHIDSFLESRSLKDLVDSDNASELVSISKPTGLLQINIPEIGTVS